MLFLAILGIGMLCAGGQKLHTAMTNRKPTVMSYADYIATKPSAAWLTLTNCQLDLVHSCYLSYIGDKNAGEQTIYYVPLFQPGADKEVHVLLKTSNPTFLKTIQEMTKLKDDQEGEKWIRQNVNRIFPRQDVTGLVCSGMDLKEQEREEVGRTQKNIADDFIILDENGQPSVAAGASCTVAGLASLCGLVLYFRKKQQQ